MATLTRRQIIRGMGLGMGLPTISAGVPEVVTAQALQPHLNNVPHMRPYPQLAGTASNSSTANLPPLGVIALNRIGYGPRPGDLEAFSALGTTDEERLWNYVHQQLDPDSIDDSDCEAKLGAENFVTMDLTLNQLWLEYGKNLQNDRYLPLKELEKSIFLRACYSERQLAERMAEFWHDHFNIYPWEYWIAPTFLHFSRDVIRKHCLGNFRELLEAVGRSPAMLYYLDNRSNKGGDPNENYARELFELHTMGAENYLGVRDLNDPDLVDETGRRKGYVDDDVYGATTCFTGWQVDVETGHFVYDDNDHFPFQKLVMGHVIPSFQGEKDGRDVYDLLVSHPGTARYICRKLCKRFISDNPPELVVQAAAAVFLANVDAPDQIAQVMRSILLSTEFRTTWGEKIKRPFDLAISILRASNANFAPEPPFPGWYEVMGHDTFRWPTPDGYPDDIPSWTSTMTMLRRWQFCTNLISWTVGGEGEDKDELRLSLLSQMPESFTTPRAIADFWIDRLLGWSPPEAERNTITAFVAQGRNIDYDLSSELFPELLAQMILLIFMSPSFQWR